MEPTANKTGWVVFDKREDGKRVKLSAPFLSLAAAEEFVILARKAGHPDCFIVGPGRDERTR
jgi:hypothetical protein